MLKLVCMTKGHEKNGMVSTWQPKSKDSFREGTIFQAKGCAENEAPEQ